MAPKAAKNMKLPGQRYIIYDEYLSEIAALDEKRKEIESQFKTGAKSKIIDQYSIYVREYIGSKSFARTFENLALS